MAAGSADVAPAAVTALGPTATATPALGSPAALVATSV
jgi:hypothetical protein